MKAGLILLAACVALLLQMTLVGMVVRWVPVDLGLVVVIWAAARHGSAAGLWTGSFVGLLQDVLSGGVLGVSGLAKSLAGVLVGGAASRFIVGTFWHWLTIFAAASVVHTVCYVGVYEAIEPGPPLATPGMIGLQTALNAGAAVAVLAAGRMVPRLRRRLLSGRRTLLRHRWILT